MSGSTIARGAARQGGTVQLCWAVEHVKQITAKLSLDRATQQSGCNTTVVLFVVLLLLAGAPVMAQPHADRPLPTPHFSVDVGSPLTGVLPDAASGVLQKPGPFVALGGADFALVSPVDDIDGMSYNRAGALPAGDAFLLLFGVDGATIGGAPPDPDLAASGRIFNVTDQAAHGQAAGDLYLSLGEFTRTSRRGPQRGGTSTSTLAANQGDTGGVDMDLSPEKSATQQHSTKSEIDNSDATAYPPAPTRGAYAGHLFISVTTGSPSLPALPGDPSLASGADIFLHDPDSGEPLELYAAAADLGLMDTVLGDDIDGMIVFDENQQGVFDQNDQVLFSLARNSPSLNNGQYSPADLFMAQFGAPGFTLFASAIELGLAEATDNIDCLELVPSEGDPVSQVFDHAIFVVWPGDHDKDGTLTDNDCAAFPSCYSGDGTPYDTDGAAVWDVEVGPLTSFVPDYVQIEAGDRVHWMWVGGLHNVVSGEAGMPDGNFYSGPPTSTPGTVFDIEFRVGFLHDHPMPGAPFPDATSVYPYFCEIHQPAMVGTIEVVPHDCATFDLDFDGDVDCVDWWEFQAVYADHFGMTCPPLSIPEFVAALLGTPIEPGHVCLADMSGDGLVNGLDVQPYVDAAI